MRRYCFSENIMATHLDATCDRCEKTVRLAHVKGLVKLPISGDLPLTFIQRRSLPLSQRNSQRRGYCWLYTRIASACFCATLACLDNRPLQRSRSHRHYRTHLRRPLLSGFEPTPASGSGAEQVFQMKTARAPGEAAPSFLGLLVNTGMLGGNACYVYAAVRQQTIYS